ncbi:hypothetical protein VE02_04155 [Pseudogymnoascus sp. 03VT05]|nr:hypothetical protein VE02_04155 [Pseudogymnoascus sp. 03VT05]
MTSRQITPYRLYTIVTKCKAGSVDTSSLEAKFFEYGGVRSVTALAAAAADNKQIALALLGLGLALLGLGLALVTTILIFLAVFHRL